MSARQGKYKTNIEKGIWRIWDAMFLSSIISVIKDSEDASEYVKALYKHEKPNIFNVTIWIVLGLLFFIFLLIVVLISKQK